MDTLHLSERRSPHMIVSLCFGTGDCRLAQNSLKGTIPESIKKMSDLEVLHLNENDLTGTIPDIFDSIRRISDLQLQKNHLKGSLPHTVIHLVDLSKWKER